MFLKKEKNEQKVEIPRRPWLCGTPMTDAIAKRDKCAIKNAYNYQYQTTLAAYNWDLMYKEMDEIERAEIQIKIGELRKFQKENGFGPWYHENDVEDKIKFEDE